MCKAIENYGKEQRLEGKLEGKIEGKIEGAIENQIETAKKMIADGEPFEKIVKYSGLPEEKVKELRKH